MAVMDLIRKPVRIATSKPARQTYLNTIIFMIASTILLCFAISAYILFYLNYIPQVGTEKIIHLQYGAGPHPYGITPLSTSLISQQPYDITLSLHVPRSPPNLDRGNFMISLALLPSTYVPALPSAHKSPHTILEPLSPLSEIAPADIIYSSRRPCILTYNSRLVSLTTRLLSLPLYILGLRSESEMLTIAMGEDTSFPKGWRNLPAYALVELQAGQDVHVYDVRIHFRAQFRGLRWIMYNHRISSFFLFTSLFWLSELLFSALAWGCLSFVLRHRTPSTNKTEQEEQQEMDKSIKQEPNTDDEPDLSDTPRTFPTYGRQAPLRYIPKIKDEEIDSEEYLIDEKDVKAEADDEDEEEGLRGAKTDSGVGTSFSEGGETKGFARRRSKGRNAGGL